VSPPLVVRSLRFSVGKLLSTAQHDATHRSPKRTSEKALAQLSEKSRRCPKRGLIGHRSYTLRLFWSRYDGQIHARSVTHTHLSDSFACKRRTNPAFGQRDEQNADPLPSTRCHLDLWPPYTPTNATRRFSSSANPPPSKSFGFDLVVHLRAGAPPETPFRALRSTSELVGRPASAVQCSNSIGREACLRVPARLDASPASQNHLRSASTREGWEQEDDITLVTLRRAGTSR
jgi:hypothetical protein